MNKRNPKNAGRKPKYTTEQLLKIIELYKLKGNLKNKIVFSDLARFAKDEMNYVDIRYYHFSENKEIAESVTKYNNLKNEAFNIEDAKNPIKLSNVNMKKLIETCYNNKSQLIYFLSLYKESVDNLLKEYLTCDTEVKELQVKVELLRKEKNILTKEKKDLANKNKKLYEAIEKIGDDELLASLSTLKYINVPDEMIKGIDGGIVDINNITSDNGGDISKLINAFPNIFTSGN